MWELFFRSSTEGCPPKHSATAAPQHKKAPRDPRRLCRCNPPPVRPRLTRHLAPWFLPDTGAVASPCAVAIYLPHAPHAPRQHPPPAPLARQVGQAGAAARRTRGRHARDQALGRARLRRGAAGAVPAPRSPSTLPALRDIGPPSRSIESMTASLNAILARPHERSERARQVLAEQPMIANHPLVSGGMPAFTPHRPPRPDKSEGGIAFKLVSEYEPKGDQPTAIAELVDGRQRSTSATRCCSASPARARPSPPRR